MVIAALLFSAAAVEVPARSITPCDLLEDGSIIIPVTIDGTGPYRFVLDTGSSRTVISTRLWRSLKRPVVARTVMVTPAGRDEAYVVRLEGVSIGERPGVSVDAAVMSADRYAAGQQVDGLIGQDVLADAIYTIDYRERTIHWHTDADVLPGVRLPLEVTNRRILVTLPQPGGSPSLSMIPDSGSDALVLFAHAKDKVRFTSLDVDVLTSLSGPRLVRRVEVDDLVIGDARLQRQVAVLVDTGESRDLLGDGLLPLHVFARVTFNVGERFLIVDAR
jgi:predicted aspartyl protease